jgi:hypothetical protein
MAELLSLEFSHEKSPTVTIGFPISPNSVTEMGQ